MACMLVFAVELQAHAGQLKTLPQSLSFKNHAANVKSDTRMSKTASKSQASTIPRAGKAARQELLEA